MASDVHITITDGRPLAVWRRRFWAVVYPVVLIGAGVLMDSAAMQWLGFIAVIASLFIAASADKTLKMTVEQARAHLDAMEGK